ncbi:DUF6464 family protein [Synechococcus sp. R3-13]|uniref:DUF6464 family protein n=2 Tax=Synechococcus TaxID=1129 RepID=UPI0039C423AB
MQALVMGVGLWLGLTFLAQLIPLLEKSGSRRFSIRDERRAMPTLFSDSAWDPFCRYFSRSPYLPCAVSPLGPCRCPHHAARPKDAAWAFCPQQE